MGTAWRASLAWAKEYAGPNQLGELDDTALCGRQEAGRRRQHPIVATKGGYTLKRDGVIVGGFGVSGGSPDEDQKICEDVLRAAGFDLDFPEWAGARRLGDSNG